MAKFSSKNKLPKRERERLLLEFCQALVVIKNFGEAANLLIDLFSEQEMEMIAKRLKIAKLLLKEETYGQIRKKLKVSDQTIARVNLWLNQSGAGYRLIVEKEKGKGKGKEKGKEKNLSIKQPAKDFGVMAGSWQAVKRKYPMYFWPQLLLEEIIKSANKSQRKRMMDTIKILKKSGEKHEVFKFIDSSLRKSSSRTQM